MEEGGYTKVFGLLKEKSMKGKGNEYSGSVVKTKI